MAGWTREEAVASLGPALFLDLPPPSPGVEAARRALSPSLSARLRAELLTLRVAMLTSSSSC